MSNILIDTGKQKAQRLALLSAVALLAIAQPAKAAPAFGQQFELSQPDGSAVPVRIWGDEYFQIVESLNGYTLVRDPASGVICYAQLSGGRLVSTGVPVGGEKGTAPKGVAPHLRADLNTVSEDVAKARMTFGPSRTLRARPDPEYKGPRPPSSGSTQGICLLVDFSDSVATIPRNDVYDFCNLPGYNGYGNNGSVRDYFYDVSDGHLTYTNYVPPVYYRAVHPKSYYDNPLVSCEVGGRLLVAEALNWLENTIGFDFSPYDANGDGVIDAINLLYAGAVSSGWSYGLWPHSSSVTFAADGVVADGYQISEMPGTLEIGTFCHENGHMLCWWPDLYDYTFASKGLGQFCLMASGASTDPVEPCCYLQDVSGWATTTVITTPERALPLTAGINSFYKFPHPTLSNEYYMVSNLQRTDRNTNVPAAGLAIWHIDTSGSNDLHQRLPLAHYLVTLVQADGLWHLENNTNSGDANDLYRVGNVTQCAPATNPNTNWWNGTASGLDFNNVSAIGATMTFNFGNPDVLEVRPLEDATLAGPLGGPFSPAFTSFTLTNAAGSPQVWTASVDVAWLTLSSTGGTLAAGASLGLDATLDASALALPAGDHTATITVTNTSSGRVQTRAVTLSVQDVSSFTWLPVASPQVISVPFDVTITAKDSSGNTTPGFTGPVTLSAFTRRVQVTGTGGSDWGYPLKTFSQDARTQVIYRAAELGGSGRIATLSLYITTPPARTPLLWTIRMKHTALAQYAAPNWEDTGWTTVCEGTSPIASSGWVDFPLATPFDYDGVSNLLVDFSFNDNIYSDYDGRCRRSTPGGMRSLSYETDSVYGDPLTWSAQTPLGSLGTSVPDMRLSFENPIASAPPTANGFVNGSWSGQVTLGSVASGVYLRADAGAGRQGTSNAVTVLTENLPHTPMHPIIGGIAVVALLFLASNRLVKAKR